VVGGVIGGVVGGVAGVLGVDQRPRFRSYVVEQRRPSYQYREDVRIGAVVGGVIGGVLGGVAGVLGVEERPRFRNYAAEQHRPSYQYREDVRIGGVLPDEGVNYYDVPPEYGARDYRYTVVNGRTVLVDPRTRRIVEIVE